ncbi:sensor histidine kinase [Actinospongicola halichondriae]|uniref:sensor histidine kinase n=1 Tax=Actinospongicola halichondriae TaxID=3236844 RepID=UPI003D440A62
MTTTVLVVEDNDGDALIIEELFSADDAGGPVHIERAASIADVHAVLAGGLEPDCALLDLGLPDAVGTEAIAALTSAAPELPIVVLTGSNDPELAGEAIRAGAQDYLVKGAGLDEEIARRAIRYAIDRASQVRALRASRRELRDFAHRVAHDLKSPMAVVLGSIDLLQRSRPDGEDAGIHEMLARSGHRLVEMVDRLLEYADTAGSDQMLATVDLDEVLEWVVQTLDTSLDDVDLEIQQPLGTVHANEVGLRHVFLNLITNSIKYAHPDRRPSIVVARKDSDDGTLVIVSDNGRGIAPEHRTSVFNAGFRLDDDVHGTGLGLATVRRSVQLVGGGVTLEDGPDGVGTTFVVRLNPAVDA